MGLDPSDPPAPVKLFFVSLVARIGGVAAEMRFSFYVLSSAPHRGRMHNPQIFFFPGGAENVTSPGTRFGSAQDLILGSLRVLEF